MHSLKKILSETYINRHFITIAVFDIKGVKGGGGELNFFNFHPILMHLSLQSVHLDELLVDLKQGSKGVSNSTFRIFERFVAFLFLFQF
jgi:hypothetical protein